MKKLDLTGQTFGQLTVLGPAEERVLGTTMWRCRCSCGNEKTLMGTVLRSGNTKSCGCLRQKNGGRPTNKEKKYIWSSAFNDHDFAAMKHMKAALESCSNGQLKFNNNGYFSRGRQYNARTEYEAIVRALHDLVDWRS